jgi:hypothetical protein
MKTKIILIITFFALTSNQVIFSQFITGFGIKAGLTYSNAKLSYTSGNPETAYHVGFNGSLFAEFINNNLFNLQINAGYDKRGYRDILIRTDEFGNEIGTDYMGWGLQYVSVGVLAKLKFSGLNFTPYLLAGPNVDFYAGYTYNLPDYMIQTGFYSNILENLKKVNYSFSLGTGIIFNKLLPYKTFVEFSYLPPINTSINNSYVKIKEYSFNLKLGIDFVKDKTKAKKK